MTRSFKSIVVLRGAGDSAESELKAFGGDDGLWEDHPFEEVSTPEDFVADSEGASVL